MKIMYKTVSNPLEKFNQHVETNQRTKRFNVKNCVLVTKLKSVKQDGGLLMG